MRNIFTLAAVFLLLPYLTLAQVTYPNRGGTGTSTIPAAGEVLVGQANGTYAPQATSTLGISGGSGSSLSVNPLVANYVTATSTSATSTFERLSVATAFNFLGTIITNVSAWYSGLFDSNLATKTTNNLSEGGSNLYFTVLRARDSLSETVLGLDYSTSTGVTSLTASYVIPTTTRAANWDTAFGWGNHATAGYLTTTATTTVRGMFSSTSPLTYNSNTGTLGVDVTGAWTGTFDALEGTAYLARANHTGTQATSTITGIFATASGGTSTSTAPGIDQILVGNGSGYDFRRVVAGTNVTVSTSTPGQIQISSTGGGSVTGLGTTSTYTIGQAVYAASNAAVGTVATGTLTTTATGLQFDITRALFGGAAILSLTAGYNIPLSASTTNWNTFYDTPSTRITAGTGIDWTANTLNGVYTAGDGITLNTEDFDCDTASGTVFGCLATTDWTIFDGKISSTSLDTSAELAGLVTDEKGSGPLVFASSTQLTSLRSFLIAIMDDISASEATTTQSFATTASSTNLFAAVINFVNGGLSSIGQAFTALGTWDFGGATSLELPNGSAPTVDTTGEIAVDTTSGHLKWFDGTRTHVITGTTSPAFMLASTTQDAAGKTYNLSTSSILLRNNPEAQTLAGFYCKASSTGSVNVRFGDGTNWTTTGYCNSTGIFNQTTSNNTFTAFEDFIVETAATATIPSTVTITTVINKTED